MELHGVGVGRGVAVGPVLEDARTAGRARRRAARRRCRGRVRDRAGAALAAVGGELAAKGEKAGGEAQAVLEAASMMAQDPMLVDDVEGPHRRGKHGGARRCSTPSGLSRSSSTAMGGYMAERATDLGDVAQRDHRAPARCSCSRRSGQRHAVRARRRRPRTRRHRAARPRQGPRARSPATAVPTSHTAILARSKSIPALVGVTRCSRTRRWHPRHRRRIHRHRGRRPPSLDQVDAAHAGDRRAAPARLPPRSPTARSPTARRCRCWPTSATPRMRLPPSSSAPRGVGLFRTEFLFLDSAHRADPWPTSRRSTPSCCRTSPARRWWCARWMRGADKPPRVPQRRARGEPPALARLCGRCAGDEHDPARSAAGT